MRIFTLCFLIIVSSSAYSDEYDIAEAAFDSGKYEEAFPLFKVLAEGGYDEAQTSLGIMYVQGFGTPIDRNEAVIWWVKASDQGNNRAQGYLGDIFSNESSNLRDDERAIHYYTLSALQGDNISQAMLGYMYAEGLGVDKSLDEAAIWFQKSANAGNTDAIRSLEYLKNEFNIGE